MGKETGNVNKKFAGGPEASALSSLVKSGDGRIVRGGLIMQIGKVGRVKR